MQHRVQVLGEGNPGNIVEVCSRENLAAQAKAAASALKPFVLFVMINWGMQMVMLPRYPAAISLTHHVSTRGLGKASVAIERAPTAAKIPGNISGRTCGKLSSLMVLM